MSSQPAGPPELTSREVCHRAMRAYERLYRLLGCDEPDLADNVTFMVGRVRLMRLAAARPWTLGRADARAALDLLERAERADDPCAADLTFHAFAQQIFARLERRAPDKDAGAPAARRAGDVPEGGQPADRSGSGRVSRRDSLAEQPR